MTDENQYYREVLDHGFVRLVDHMGGDLAISRAARVSYDAPPREEDEKLIRYLWQHKHTTPFEAVTLTFEVKAPIFVLRQWHRHRMWSYNELSARYKELPEEFYIPDPALIGQQAKDNKQMRVIGEVADDLVKNAGAASLMRITNEASFEAYRALIALGVPRELARSVLPVATYSHMFATVNLRSLFHFLGLRTHEHAQYEIKVYADAMAALAKHVAPHAVKAWEDFK